MVVYCGLNKYYKKFIQTVDDTGIVHLCPQQSLMPELQLLTKILRDQKLNLSITGFWVPFLGIFPLDLMSIPAGDVLHTVGDIWLADDDDSIFIASCFT